MESLRHLNIAFVQSVLSIDEEVRDVLYNQMVDAAKSNVKYSNVKFSSVEWDSLTPVNWSEFTHIVMAGGLEYMQAPVAFRQWLDSLPDHSRVFNPPDLIKWNMNKIYLKELQEKGIPIPESIFIENEKSASIDELVNELETKTKRKAKKIVLKPLVSCNGVSTYLVEVEDKARAQNILDEVLTNYKDGIIVQELLNAVSTDGEWALVYLGGQLTHAAVKHPKDGEFRVQSDYGGRRRTVEVENVPQEFKNLANSVLETMKCTDLLYARIDMVRGNDGHPALMEFEIFEPELYLATPELREHFLKLLVEK